MIVKITYKGLGKLDDWYGHEDYHKGRTINGANEINVLGNDVSIKVRGETIVESLDEIESIRIVEPLEERLWIGNTLKMKMMMVLRRV